MVGEARPAVAQLVRVCYLTLRRRGGRGARKTGETRFGRGTRRLEHVTTSPYHHIRTPAGRVGAASFAGGTGAFCSR